MRPFADSTPSPADPHPRDRSVWMAALIVGLIVAVVLALLVLTAPGAAAQTRIGAHAGVIVPIATFSDQATTTVDENVVYGHPVGIGIGREGSPWTFDLEFVPLVDLDPQSIDLLVHPGVLYAATPRLALGVRYAFEVDADAYGFTPLVAYRLADASGLEVFVELDVPVRFVADGAGGTTSSVAIVPHLGVSF